MKNFGYLIFVAMTFIAWGVYGPVLHQGQHLLGVEGQPSSLRPLIGVGVAYFVIAVMVPLYVLSHRGEQGRWSLGGFLWSLSAGALGALGALGIVLAFKFRGDPVYVMPLVFGAAPVVNTIVTMVMARSLREASTWFYLGVIVVAVGAAGVMFFKPGKTGDAQPAAEAAQTEPPPGDGTETERAEGQERVGSQAPATTPPASPSTARAFGEQLMVFFSIGLTAFCWGSYGPILHRGQAKMGGSRLRPFLCVGLAYFVLAVVLPIVLLPTFPEPGGITWGGAVWSLLAGTAGAIGALGIIYAFNFGGRPMIVMPLVFGGAPVINTLTEMATKSWYGQISQWFFASLALVILGAVTVLVCAPRPKPKAASEPTT